jgi:hypothetical protein
LLGGGDWIRAPDDPDQHDNIVFVDDARENLGDLEFSLVLTTRRLLPNQYPEARSALADRVVCLREKRKLTFKAIASILSKDGLRGARGASLNAQNVFALYQKRKRYKVRQNNPVQYHISNVIVHPIRNQSPATIKFRSHI